MRTPIPLDNEKELIEYWSKSGLLNTATNQGLIARCFEIATEYIFNHEKEFSEILTIILPIILRLLIQHNGNVSNEQLEKYVHELIPEIKKEYANFEPIRDEMIQKGYIGLEAEAEFCDTFANTYKKTP